MPLTMSPVTNQPRRESKQTCTVIKPDLHFLTRSCKMGFLSALCGHQIHSHKGRGRGHVHHRMHLFLMSRPRVYQTCMAMVAGQGQGQQGLGQEYQQNLPCGLQHQHILWQSPMTHAARNLAVLLQQAATVQGDDSLTVRDLVFSKRRGVPLDGVLHSRLSAVQVHSVEVRMGLVGANCRHRSQQMLQHLGVVPPVPQSGLATPTVCLAHTALQLYHRRLALRNECNTVSGLSEFYWNIIHIENRTDSRKQRIALLLGMFLLCRMHPTIAEATAVVHESC